MKIETVKIGLHTVLVPQGSLTHETCRDMDSRLKELIEQGKISLALDLKAVQYLDSEALEALVRAHERLRGKGGALALVGPGPVCRDILIATRLVNVFSVYEDLHEMVRSQS